MKKLLALTLAAVVATGSLVAVPADAYTDSSLGSRYIGKIGKSTKTFYKGDEFELEVRKGTRVKDSDLYWEIKNDNIVRFEDSDRSDDEIELKALMTGETKVYCHNNLTGAKVIYTIKVEPVKAGVFRVGDATKNIHVGSTLDLEVKKVGLKDNQVKWSIENTSILSFDDGEIYGDEVEVVAKKAGTTKVYAKNLLSGKSAVYTINVKESPSGVFRIGKTTKVVEVGDDLEVEVRKVGLKESQIEWSIGNTSLLRFEDGDNIGSEVEIKALKTGNTKIYAKNLVSGKSAVYDVKIVPDYDD